MVIRLQDPAQNLVPLPANYLDLEPTDLSNKNFPTDKTIT